MKITVKILLLLLFLLGNFVFAGILDDFRQKEQVIDNVETAGTLTAFSAGLASGCGDIGDWGDCSDGPGGCSSDFSGVIDCSDACVEPSPYRVRSSAVSVKNGKKKSMANMEIEGKFNPLFFYGYYGEKDYDEGFERNSWLNINAGYEFINNKMYAFSVDGIVWFLTAPVTGLNLDFSHFEEKISSDYITLNITYIDFFISADSKNTTRIGFGLMGVGSVFTYACSFGMSARLIPDVFIVPRFSLGFFKGVTVTDFLLRIEYVLFSGWHYFAGVRSMTSRSVKIEGIQIGFGGVF